jgi:hypothetical protein
MSHKLAFASLACCVYLNLIKQSISVDAILFFQKGGDPAAPSDTATLLRLNPSHESHRGNRPPCG